MQSGRATQGASATKEMGVTFLNPRGLYVGCSVTEIIRVYMRTHLQSTYAVLINKKHSGKSFESCSKYPALPETGFVSSFQNRLENWDWPRLERDTKCGH